MNVDPKNIGTVNLNETKEFSTSVPWEAVTKAQLPYTILTKPNGFLFTHGSACASMATTSHQGYRYIEDTYIFRQDGTAVDVDRYLGSITPQNTQAVLKVPSGQIPFHHLRTSDSIFKELPADKQAQILSILEPQNP